MTGDRLKDAARGVPAAIVKDLGDLQLRRRRHFLPALMLAFLVVALPLMVLGTRADLLDQPGWQVALQVGSWVVCLIAFPAVGVGLWFPGRNSRIALAIGGTLLAVTASIGWHASAPMSAEGGGPCWMILSACGVVLVGIGALSGAFAVRRGRSSVYWVAAGVALAALDCVTWMCPDGHPDHVLPMHFLPAVAVVFAAGALGVMLHRKAKR